MSKTNIEKYIFVQRILEESPTCFIHLNGTHQDVELPQFLLKKEQVVLQIGYTMPIPIPDLTICRRGISGTLSFNGQPEYCFLPWEAIFAVIDENNKGITWDSEIPKSVLKAIKHQDKVKDGFKDKEGFRDYYGRGNTKKQLPDYLRIVK